MPTTTKFTTLANLDRYTTHVEEKNVQVTRDEYTNLPSSKLTDNRSYFIEDEGVVIKNGVEYGGNSAGDTTYSLSVGTGEDTNKIVLTPSTGDPDKIIVPYATSAGNANTVSNHTVAKDVPADAKFTDTTYSNATTSAAGLMSSDDKTKLNGIAIGAEVNVKADWNEASSSSDAYILNKPTLGTAAAANTTDFDAAGTAASAIAALDSSTDDNTVTDTTDTSLNLLTSVTIQNGLITAKKHTTFTIATQQEIANIFS